MRIAFYAPLKAPDHPVPSGDRRVARLLMQALTLAGHQLELASTLRSFEGSGDLSLQRGLRDQGLTEARRLTEGWLARPPEERPVLWFTYHLYYKAPDWIGPFVADALRIPYVVCEASFAPKRAGGPWQIGHDAVAAALTRADLLLAPTGEDLACLAPVVGHRGRIERLPPFLDSRPYARAVQSRFNTRAKLVASHGIDSEVPWLLVVGMMRRGDKLASYRQLALALTQLLDLSWQLLVVGDGIARDDVHHALEQAAPGRVHWLGECDGEWLADVTASADLCAWPAVNEAYGMALLEAQAAGLPVVACSTRGVPDVVRHGETGLLVPGGDMVAFARAVRLLLLDAPGRHRMGAAAARFARDERSLERAAASLGSLLAQTQLAYAARVDAGEPR